ncbi:MAG: ABC transporter ATP-binding protein [Gammaproteobacteria bacterium]
MRLLRQFVLRYPWQSAFLVLVLLAAGVADGLGLSALLPMLNLAFESGGGAPAPAGADDGFTRFITDGLAAVGLTPSLGTLLLIIVSGITLKRALIFVAEQRIGYIAADVATELRLSMLAALTRSRWSHFVGQSAGRLANAMATEAWRASNAYVFAIKLLVLLVELSVYGVLAVLVSWQATLLTIGASLAIVALSHNFVRLARKAGKGQTRWYASLLRTLTDLLGSVKSLKAMGRERQAEALLQHETHNLRRELKREVLGNAALDAAQEPLQTVVLGIGIYVAIAKLGMDISTVTFLVLILARLLSQAGKVQKQYQKMVGCESAYWSLVGMVADARAAEEPLGEPIDPRTQAPLQDAIRLDDVTLAYGEEPVLDRVSLTIPAGRMTCLVGESGTGKSTIADLIIGLIRPQAGTVSVDGTGLDALDLRSWRRAIGYVPQDNVLLHDTVMRNVALADAAVTEAAVRAALARAGALEFVLAMPGGLHADVGEGGARLSGGQRQRILIARALVHEPALLILDEATSALDAATEQALCEMLDSLRGQMTILAISHQQALRALADRVYRVERGRIVLLPEAAD